MISKAGMCRITLPFVAIASLVSITLQAQTAIEYAAAPPLLRSTAPPRVMLLLSNDQQLYHKAYTDYTDLDGDGVLDTSYNDAFDYYGYFNSDLCYDYNNERFEPAPPPVDRVGHQCGGNWSGNFLNWASMTRMDIVRRVYYGGKRMVDTAEETVLQRAFLPNDAHAFVKVYKGEDVASFTPYSSEPISLCNVTLATGQANAVDERTFAPLLRVAEGDFSLWSATEVVQCMYQSEAGDSGKQNRPVSGNDYLVRVLSCVDGQDAGAAYCRPYGAAPAYKPAGVLQQNSEDGSILFGLMTGTHEQKIEGGILRRNITALAGNGDPTLDEVDLNTGSFRYLNGDLDGGIIQTIDSMRIAGWNYDNNLYADCNTYSITVEDFVDNSPLADGKLPYCRDWGNPLAEMYMEALRYFPLTATQR